MAEKISLEIITPGRVLLSGEVDEVIAPGVDGEFGVLHEHTPFLSILDIGVLRFLREGKEERVAVTGGFGRSSRQQGDYPGPEPPSLQVKSTRRGPPKRSNGRREGSRISPLMMRNMGSSRRSYAGPLPASRYQDNSSGYFFTAFSFVFPFSITTWNSTFWQPLFFWIS